MKSYTVTGMSCAACSARVEKAVSKLDGVDFCSVNLLTKNMRTDGSATDEEIIAAVRAAGYDAYPTASQDPAARREESGKNPILVRLIVSAALLLPLMYISMGRNMLGLWLPSFLAEAPALIGLLQLILCVAVMITNRSFFINGIRALIRLSPNMDTLVAVGSGASFAYSTYILAVTVAESIAGNIHTAHGYLHELYFESAAMILVLITVGKLLESLAKGKTTSAIKELMELTPKTATVIVDSTERVIPVEELRCGDIFILRPGDSIPADAVVIEGESAVDESALTGESIPCDKRLYDTVSAATVNVSGYLKCRATRVGEDTAISAVIRLVNDAVSTKAPIAKIADTVSGIFVPAVMAIAAITAVLWLLSGAGVGYSLARGISVLVISCPCALGLATPVAIMVGSGVGARCGILFKNAQALELCGRARTVVLDKTGTVTKGKPQVVGIIPCGEFTEEELLTLSYSIEYFSEHPLATAINEYAFAKGIEKEDITDFKALSGSGVSASYKGKELIGGSLSFIDSKISASPELKELCQGLSGEGKTPLCFAYGGKILGIIAVADELKEDATLAISELLRTGVDVIMLTGDNEGTAQAIAKKAGISKVIAGVKPDGKEAVIRELCSKGKTVMVGDGINDAPALTRAHVGMAIAGGTDIAIESADVVLVGDKLSSVPTAIRLGRCVLRNIKENLFWAFFYNTVGIPLAAGAFIQALGWELNPMFGAAAMSLSSFCVVTNALRIYLFNRGKKAKSRIDVNNSIQSNEFTVKVGGMMCGHCEARVSGALTALSFVSTAKADHKSGNVYITVSDTPDRDAIRAAVNEAGYKFRSIK